MSKILTNSVFCLFKDILEADTMSLDWEFRYSLISDIVKETRILYKALSILLICSLEYFLLRNFSKSMN